MLSLISKESPEMGVLMTYEGGNSCNETAHYSLTVQLNCNPNLQKTTYALDKETIKTPCSPKVIMNSPYACPIVSTGALGRFIDEYKYFLAIPLIIVGFYLVIFGGRWPQYTLAIFSTLAITFFLLFILYMMVLPYFVPTWTVWITGFVCLGLGAGMGYASAVWKRIGITVQSFSLGCLFGYWLYAAVLKSHNAA